MRKFKDLFISVIIDVPFYLLGCWAAVDYVGYFCAAMFFIVFTAISIERAVNDKQTEVINGLRKELDNLKDELRTYKEQVLEG